MDHRSRQGPAICGAAVKIESVAIVSCFVDGGMAVDDQPAVVMGIVKKVPAYPDKIILGLVCQGDAGPDSGMDKDGFVKRKMGWSAFKELMVRHRNCSQRVPMDRCYRAVGCAAHPIGGQRCPATQSGMQPGMFWPQTRVLPLGIIEELGKEAVMVAFQHHPVATGFDPAHQEIDDTLAVGATINQIAKMDDLAMTMQRHIRVVAVMG